MANIKGTGTPSISIIYQFLDNQGWAVINHVFLCIRISPGEKELGS